eukprot:1180399-Prorocentrum_minimum.AAC.3
MGKGLLRVECTLAVKKSRTPEVGPRSQTPKSVWRAAREREGSYFGSLFEACCWSLFEGSRRRAHGAGAGGGASWHQQQRGPAGGHAVGHRQHERRLQGRPKVTPAP